MKMKKHVTLSLTWMCSNWNFHTLTVGQLGINTLGSCLAMCSTDEYMHNL